jgi:diguanylate cyclase (GGDEF)-like protein/PAS domain S-box-containing protein
VLLSSPGHPHQHQPGNRKRSTLSPDIERDPAFDRFTRLATSVTNAPVGVIVLEHAGQLVIKSAAGTSELIEPCATIPQRRCLCQNILETQRPLAIGDTSSRSCWLVEQTGIQAYLGVPITLSDGTTVGALSVGAYTTREWSDTDIEALTDIVALTAEEIARQATQQADDQKSDPVNEIRGQKEQRQESELRKRAIVESALDSIITIDHEGYILEFNSAAERTFGFAREDAIGSLMADLIMPQESRNACLTSLSRHLQSGESSVLGQRIERKAMRADGVMIDVEMAVTRIDIPDRDFPIFTAYLRDITERKRAEEEVLFHKHMVDAVGQVVIANDNSPRRRINYWNRAAEEVLGWTAAEAIGQGFYDIVPPEDFHENVRQIGQRVRQGETWSGEFRMRHKDGTVIPALASVAPILDEDGELLGVISAYTDLTEIKQTEQQIRLYKHIVDAVGESVVASDMGRRIFYANPAAEHALGWSTEDVRGLDIRDVVPAPDFRERSSWIGTEVRKTGERISGEFVLRRENGETFPALVTLAPIFADNKELVGTIGIYTDISELKQTESDLRFHKHAIDAVGQAIIANDLDRRITYLNPAAEELLGWRADEVLGRDFYEIIPPESFRDTVREIGRRARQGEAWHGEFQLRHRDGQEIPALSSVRPVYSEDGEIIGVIGTHSDLREIKTAERAIRFYKHLTDATGQALVANDLHRRITYWNQAAEATFGWMAEEIIGRDFYALVGLEDRIEEMHRIGAQVRDGHVWSGEFTLKRKNGQAIPVLMSVSPVLDNDGNPTQIIGAYTDVSELKRTEQENRFFKHIVSAIAEAVVATSLEGNITYVNAAAEQMLGWKAEELIGRPLISTIPDPARIEEARGISEFVRSDQPWFGEFRLRRKDGSTFPALISIAPVLDESGETSGIISVYTDISELKRTEEDLRFHKHIVDAVGQAVVVSDTAGHITYWNKAAENLYEWPADEALGQLVFEVLAAPHDTERARDITETVARGETWAGESPVKKRDGTEFLAYFTVSPIRDTSGEIVGIIGVSHDISEQKEYQRQIEFHKIMLDAVGQTIVTTDMNRVITYWSKGAEEALGWTAEEVVGRPIAEIAPAAHLQEEAGKLHRQVREGDTWQGEFPIRRKDGSTFPAVVTLAPVNLADQGTVGVIGVYTDVSELKETAEELRLHKHMLDAVGQAVCATDEQLRVTYWNRAAEELFGYTPSEAIGMHLFDFRPEVARAEAAEAVEIVSQSGSWTGEMLLYHKDGTEIAALVSVSPIASEDGRQIGLTVAMADISIRKRIEEELKNSNKQITEILESMGDGFFSVDSNWTFTYINRQGEKALRRTREELIGRNVWDEFPYAKDRAFFDMYRHTFKTGQPTTFIEFSPDLDAWFEVQAFRSREQLSVFFRDVTQRREREVALREAEHRYRTLVEQLPAMTYIAEPEDVGAITYISPQIELMLGYSPEEWLNRPEGWTHRIHPDDHQYVIEHDEATIREGRERFTLEYRLRAADGTYRWIRDTATLIRDIKGRPSYWQGLSYDITEQKRAERAVQENEQRFRSLFENHPDAVFSIDHSGRVLSANPAFMTMTGYSRSERNNDFHFVEIVVLEDQQRVRERFAKTHQGAPQDFRAGVIDLGGRRLELNLTTIPIIVDNDIVGVHVVAQDVTIHQELENQLAHQAFHDALTGLPNRNLFQNRLEDRIEIARRHENQFAVLFFDLDDFKVINDSLGHSAGDRLLIEVSRRVQTCIRGTDLLARLGGDEFTLLLEHVEGSDDAVAIAERVAQVLDEQFIIEGHEVFATTSIGIALGDQSTPSADDILRNADLAMYEAKNSGKDRYAIFEPSMNSRAWLRLTLETEIRRGIPRNEFEVYYQPIINLETGEMDGVEALIRWNHPERGFLAPKEFISVAEQSGLILPLGRWIIRAAATQLRQWQQLMPNGKPLRLSLNLSPKQYQHPRLIEELTRTLTNVDLDPRLITLEITESIAMDDSPETIKTLQQLKDVGVRLALDDFGTGFSALSYLRRFPIDVIKIDQTFVSGLGIDLEDTNIVRAVMAASLAMDLRVTAEGIETVEQLTMLKEFGCQFGQGYLFSYALSANEMQELIITDRPDWRNLIEGSAVAADDHDR